MGLILLGVLVLVLAGAAWVDHLDRKHGGPAAPASPCRARDLYYICLRSASVYARPSLSGCKPS